MSESFELEPQSRIHIIGIGGAGMSAIAKILNSSGYVVSGSDATASPMTEELGGLGIKVFIGHDSQNVEGVDVVTHSTAVSQDNPEIVAAKQSGIPVQNRAQTLAAVTQLFDSLLIAGTHGKTTTSSMAASVFMRAGLDPSFIIGGKLAEFGTGARLGSGKHLIVEADESDGTFLTLKNSACVVTNIEKDHIEFYGTTEKMVEAFQDFVVNAAGPVVLCGDDPGCVNLRSSINLDGTDTHWYGFTDDADVRIHDYSPDGLGSTFQLAIEGNSYPVKLLHPGKHNALNTAAAVALAVAVGVPPELAVKASNEFAGVARRYEFRGEHNGIVFVDDYAHLPTEVEAAISAAKSSEAKRLVAVYQPHRYSRTQALYSEFGKCFSAADKVIITGIYSSGEEPREGITGKLVADQVKADDPNLDLTYIESLEDVQAALVGELSEGDLCLTLGAGDLTKMADLVLEDLGGK